MGVEPFYNLEATVGRASGSSTWFLEPFQFICSSHCFYVLI